jgi:cytochrome P450
LSIRIATAQALSWTFYRLQLNPRVLAKLVEEIDSAVSKLPPGQDINYEVVKSLTYAHCCISETLRLHPSVPKNQKTALEDDTLPDGTFVPKGASVAHIPWVMGRSKEIWGEDAEEYRPER